MNYDYPLLQKVFNHFKDQKKDVSDIHIISCQHLLEPQLKMFEMFIEYGFKPENIIVLGKIYSTNQSIVDEMRAKNIKVVQPKFSGIYFDDEHKNNCKEIVDSISDESKVIVIDDGADLIRKFSDSNKNVLFAIEQTSSGFRILEKEKPRFSVINVARSVTKLTHESPLIAQLCFERISDYLSDKIKNPNILIVGLGPIGEAIMKIFKKNEFSVSGFDIKYGDNNLRDHIKQINADVIIGATGFQILSKEDIENLVSEKPLHLISVSSSDREFPAGFFRNSDEIHKDIKFNNITFVNNGFPIAFKGNRNELTPIEIEKTICLIGGSVLSGITKEFKTSGLINVPEDLEELISKYCENEKYESCVDL